MARPRSTGRQVMLVASILGVTIGTLSVLGLSLYYSVLFRFWPELFETDQEWSWLDGGYLALTALVVVPAAGLVGWWLSRRMVRPLVEVARAVRAIAGGDLTARADAKVTGYWESQNLIHDFNMMAEQLERGEAERTYSNSAIAHELRTPLTILKGRLQGISDGVFALTRT